MIYNIHIHITITVTITAARVTANITATAGVTSKITATVKGKIKVTAKITSKTKPTTQSMKPPAESKDHRRNEKFQEVEQHARLIAGEKSEDNNDNPQTDVFRSYYMFQE